MLQATPKVETNEVVRKRLALVVDRSGSMSKEKMAQA